MPKKRFTATPSSRVAIGFRWCASIKPLPELARHVVRAVAASRDGNSGEHLLGIIWEANLSGNL